PLPRDQLAGIIDELASLAILEHVALDAVREQPATDAAGFGWFVLLRPFHPFRPIRPLRCPLHCSRPTRSPPALNAPALSVRVHRLDQLSRGIAREISIVSKADDPLLYLERVPRGPARDARWPRSGAGRACEGPAAPRAIEQGRCFFAFRSRRLTLPCLA